MQTEPSGESSVMPQAWVIGSPIFARHASDSALGTAEPPQITMRSADRSCSSSSGTMPIQIVGTPAGDGDPLGLQQRDQALRADRSGPGMTSEAPARNAA